MALTLMYITNKPDVATIAQDCGVDRIWIDLETLGKEERQGHIDSVKSQHTIDDIRRMRPAINKAEVLVRVNPIYPDSKKEINAAIEAGADMIMLPMWKSVCDVDTFLEYVNGRVKTTLLLETKEAAECLDNVLALGGFDEIHIGLNDLHLSYGMDFMFELLANGTVEGLCEKIKKYGLPYGFGGIARIGEGQLSSERIIMEHYRLGSTRAILSRSFCNVDEIYDAAEIEEIFAVNVKRLRDYESTLRGKTEAEYADNVRSIQCCVTEIVSKIKERKAQ